jgi:hypothetical protein
MIPARFMLFGVLASISANAEPIQFESSERQAALVELYTSEGCSSCPSAESWLTRLKDKQGLWIDFIPIAFHVDYWDYLGWRDKWSSKQYSDRQRDYAGAWGGDSIYTPEFVLNGKEWHNWFELRGAPGLSESKPGILKVTSEDTHHWQVSFIPTEAGKGIYEVNAALLVSDMGSDVKAGENTGRHLQHDFAVVKLIKEPLTGKDDGFQGVFTIAAVQNAPGNRLALAVWATHSGGLDPVQSVGGWLTPPKKDK